MFTLIVIMESGDLLESRFGRNTVLFLLIIENTLSSAAFDWGIP